MNHMDITKIIFFVFLVVKFLDSFFLKLFFLDHIKKTKCQLEQSDSVETIH